QRAPDRALDLRLIADRRSIAETELRHEAEFLVRRGVLSRPASGHSRYDPAVRVDHSWAYSRDLFQIICTRLFLDKDPAALQYDAPDDYGILRCRWMAPDDLGFLIGVGMRLLIEAYSERGVLLYGVVKDSAPHYLTRNFLGVALQTGFYPELADLP